MKKRFRLFIIATSFGLASVVTVLVLRSDLFKVRKISIEKDPASNELFLFKKIHSDLQAEMKSYLGRPVWEVSLHQILKLAQADQRIRSIRIERQFPNKIDLVVTPQDPKLAYMDDRGRIFPIAEDSSLLPALSLKESPSYPLLRGSIFKKDAGLRVKAVALFEAIPVKGPFRQNLVSEMSYSKADGFRIFLSDVKVEIKMGTSEFGQKASRVNHVLSYLEDRDIKGRVIDARFSKKVVVRVRNAP